MRLYHFTPAHMIDGIITGGLTKGAMPMLNRFGEVLGFTSDVQWLTKESDFNKQAWATQNLINYDRTAYRLSVVIPITHYNNLYDMDKFLKYIIHDGTKRMIRETQGYKDWYVYLGKIPADWIKESVKKRVSKAVKT
ncbi:MAG: hypothetical protein ACRDBM_13715 [Sporomusa sp.]